jgi:C4-dicarboxylate-specific signal transduction histidine kinase
VENRRTKNHVDNQPGTRAWRFARQVALAAICVGLALLVTEGSQSVFPTPLFFAAIVISTWLGGAASGITAVILATLLLNYAFVPPAYHFALKPGQWSYLTQFVVPALLTYWFVQKRKDAESSLRHARDELEFKVEERTGELRHANEQLQAQITERLRAEEALQKTQAELAHVSRVMTMGELAASIAHEVNQPLMAVVINGDACLQWLERQPPNLAEAREAVGRIISEGNRAGEIIRRIRALIRKSSPQKSPMQMNEVLPEIIALTQKQLSRAGITVITHLDPALPPVMGDRVQLQQVVLNLVVNAIEAVTSVPEGPRRLCIVSRRDDCGAVVISVHDSGPGLPADDPDRLFGAFFTTKPHGLGMGLSISRTIVEAHGGRMWGENEPGGAVFQFRLPAYSGAAS